MFDVGFSELLVIAVVALLVLGPERLPRAARFAGLWVRRARAQWHSVRAELERDLASEELQRSLKDAGAAMRDAQASLRDIQASAGGQDLMRGPSSPPTPPPADAEDDAR
jgi:sec-independent protein translocase protein TatB